jgi:hypothetical protein
MIGFRESLKRKLIIVAIVAGMLGDALGALREIMGRIQ